MLENLIRHYGVIAGAKYGYSCRQNALHNGSLAIFAEMPKISILLVDTPDLCHAYLTDGENAYSEGLTWRDNRYPELTIAEISLLGGTDITHSLILAVLRSNTFYTIVLDNLEKQIPGITKRIKEHISS